MKIIILIASILFGGCYSKPKISTNMDKEVHKEKEIFFAGGCFWGTEHFFKQIQGVTFTQVGYANGNTKNPTYEEVCTDETGFTEAVKVQYNPEIVSLGFLIDLFFKTIDPTSLNKQGGDVGTQYRTGIYFELEKDKQVILNKLEELQKQYNKKIVVECLPIENFYPAEDYHQDYLDKNPTGYCHIPYELFKLAKDAKENK